MKVIIMALLMPVGSLNWTASTSTDVVGYNVYYGDATTVDYNSPKVSVGLVTTVALPVAGQPPVDGDIKYAVAPVDDAGNIGDLTIVTVSLDTIAPDAVTNLAYVAP